MIYHLYTLITLYALSFGLGYYVLRYNLRVNYSRKILSICFFCITTYLLYVSNYKLSAEYYWIGRITSFCVPLLWLITMLKPFRERFSFFNICFLSVDRPEDRPFTLTWLITALLTGYWILIVALEILYFYDAAKLIFIITFISTFGDGLAEPIGIKFGKHPYKTRALFTKKTYIRTLEGSACVFLSGISAVIAAYSLLTAMQFIVLLCALPLAMTIVEAKSPHTWDNPFLHLVGGAIIILTIAFIS